MKKRAIILLLSCALQSSYAQHFIQQLYTAVDGLPSSYPFSVTEDKDGYLWIGSVYGASKFNGSVFQNYGTEINLPSIVVRRILPDSKGTIWIGVQTGIVRLKDNVAQQFPVHDSAVVHFTHEVAETPDGKIWWLTDAGTYEFQGDSWKRITLDSTEFPARQLAFIDGDLYASYGDRVIIHGKGKKTVITNPDAPYQPYYRILRKCNNRVFVSSNYSLNEIVDGKVIPRFASVLNESKKTYLYWFLLDRKNRMWFATENGIWISAPNSEEIVQKIDHPGISTSDIFEDRLGNIWVATSDGLIKLTDSHRTVIELPALNIITSFATKNNKLYLGTTDDQPSASGLFKYENNLVRPATPSNALKTELIDSYTEDNKGDLWITTRRGRVFRVRDKVVSGIALSEKHKWVRDVKYNATNDRFYASSSSVYVMRVDPSQPNALKTESIVEGIPYPMSLFIDKSGAVWSANEHGQLFYLKGDSVRRMNDVLGIRALKNPGKVIFVEDADGLWIAYPGYGMRRYRFENGSPVLDFDITTRIGLPNDFVKSMVLDDDGGLWAVTDSGPVYINLLEKSLDGFLIADLTPFVRGEHNWGRAGFQKLADNQIVLHVSHALFVFEKNVDYRMPPPDTRLEYVSVRDSKSQVLKDSIVQATSERLVLNYHQNSLQFKYEAISLAGLRPRFSFRLLNADTSWSIPTNNAIVSFPSLEPGQYQFEVRSRLSNSNWSEPARMTFVIRPPFWQTWWFKLSMVLIVVVIVGSILKWYVDRIKAKQRVQNQLADLELRALKSQMSPHFVFNAMNSIQALIADEKPAVALRYTSKFSKLLRTVLENSEKNFITLEKEISSLDLYIQIEALRLNVELDYAIEVDSSVSPEYELIPPMIVQPYVENSLWHGLSSKTGDRRLRIRFGGDDELLLCEIEDNGIGRKKSGELRNNKSPNHHSKGQSITEKRLSLINHWDHSSVQILDLVDNQGNAAGTRVILQLKKNRDRN